MSENEVVMPVAASWEKLLPPSAVRSLAASDQALSKELDEIRAVEQEHASALFAARMAGKGRSLTEVLEWAGHAAAREDARDAAERQRQQNSGIPVEFDGKAHVEETAAVARMKARRDQAERDAADPAAAQDRRIRASIAWHRLNG
jgi:hypothetical protein